MNKPLINVAVAVISYDSEQGERFLLAKRHAHQHQGDKLEFVGGKIEQGEQPKQTLIREVREELGVDITPCTAKQNGIQKMGEIRHLYDDKEVNLVVYRVRLTDQLYGELSQKSVGTDNQPLFWCSRHQVIELRDDFPEANSRIIHWLTLPSQIVISDTLANLTLQGKDLASAYGHLPQNSWLRVRLQCPNDDWIAQIGKLGAVRPDIRLIVPAVQFRIDTSFFDDLFGKHNIVAVHYTEQDVFGFSGFADSWLLDLLKKRGVGIFSSCHSLDNLTRLHGNLRYSFVWGLFVSPVKPTKTHPDAVPIGLDGLGAMCEQSFVPVYGLGGLTADDVPAVQSVGAVGVAGIRGFV